MDDETIHRYLEFERRVPRNHRGRHRLIREEFGLLPGRYYYELGQVIDSPRALELEPVTTLRLRRNRDTQRRVRSGEAPVHPSREPLQTSLEVDP